MPSSIIILHIEITVLGYLGISLVFTHTHIILLFISLLQYIPTKKTIIPVISQFSLMNPQMLWSNHFLLVWSIQLWMETPLSIKEPIRNRKNPASTWHEQPGIWPFVHSQFLSLNMVTYLRRHIQQTTVFGVLLIWEAKQNRGHKAQEEERTDFVCICMCVYIYILVFVLRHHSLQQLALSVCTYPTCLRLGWSSNYQYTMVIPLKWWKEVWSHPPFIYFILKIHITWSQICFFFY